MLIKNPYTFYFIKFSTTYSNINYFICFDFILFIMLVDNSVLKFPLPFCFRLFHVVAPKISSVFCGQVSLWLNAQYCSAFIIFNDLFQKITHADCRKSEKYRHTEGNKHLYCYYEMSLLKDLNVIKSKGFRIRFGFEVRL